MKTRIAYLRILEDLLLRLAACIRRMGFTSRSEYFATCAAAIVLAVTAIILVPLRMDW